MKDKFELGPNQIKWIEALESGNYEQGIGYLNKDNKYCCLGVACELFHKELDITKANCASIIFYDDLSRSLPFEVINHLKLNTKVGNPNIKYSYLSLAEMNDRGDSFTKIADHLRQNAQAYFTESA